MLDDEIIMDFKEVLVKVLPNLFSLATAVNFESQYPLYYYLESNVTEDTGSQDKAEMHEQVFAKLIDKFADQILLELTKEHH